MKNAVRNYAEELLWNQAKHIVKKSRGYTTLKQIGKDPKDWGLVEKIYKLKRNKHLDGMGEMNFDARSAVMFGLLGVAVFFVIKVFNE